MGTIAQLDRASDAARPTEVAGSNPAGPPPAPPGEAIRDPQYRTPLMDEPAPAPPAGGDADPIDLAEKLRGWAKGIDLYGKPELSADELPAFRAALSRAADALEHAEAGRLRHMMLATCDRVRAEKAETALAAERAEVGRRHKYSEQLAMANRGLGETIAATAAQRDEARAESERLRAELGALMAGAERCRGLLQEYINDQPTETERDKESREADDYIRITWPDRHGLKASTPAPASDGMRQGGLLPGLEHALFLALEIKNERLACWDNGEHDEFYKDEADGAEYAADRIREEIDRLTAAEQRGRRHE